MINRITFLILFFCSNLLFAQNPIISNSSKATPKATDTTQVKEVEIIHADKLEFNTKADGTQVRKLVGAVELKHENTLMTCDSAYLYKEINLVNAWGNIHIIDNDSVHAYSNSLIYEGNSKKAQLIGDAKIIDNNKTLTSDILIYDMKNKKGYYNNKGKLETDSTILVSQKGIYFTQTKIAEFRYDVVVTDPNYNLESDSLHYNTSTKVASFYGPTTIYNDSSTINCILGTYDTENEIATFGKGTIINNEPQTLLADSLYYERLNGYAKAFYYFDWVDTEIEAGLEGTSAEYFENNQEIIAYNRPLLKVKQENDTLFLKGEIIHSKENDTHGQKEFWSFDKVRIFKEDLQGISDSLFYSFNDSMMRLFYDPLLWNDANQLEGDTIIIQLKNDEVDQVQFLENAFVSMQSKGRLFDQIKGKTITAYFVNSEMERMLANKNAESLYFGKNDDDEYIGGNYALSNKMMVYMVDKEVDRITFIEQPEATFTPISKMPKTSLYLKGFTWQEDLRPKGKWDL